MRLGKFFAAVAAASMAFAPAMAAPTNPAASLSVSKSVRAGASKGKGDSLLGATGGGAIVAVLAAAAVIAGIVVVATDNNNDGVDNIPVSN